MISVVISPLFTFNVSYLRLFSLRFVSLGKGLSILLTFPENKHFIPCMFSFCYCFLFYFFRNLYFFLITFCLFSCFPSSLRCKLGL